MFGRNISFSEIAPLGWGELTVQTEMRFTAIGNTSPADGHGFRLQDSGTPVADGNFESGSSTAINLLTIHFDLFRNTPEPEVPHVSVVLG